MRINLTDGGKKRRKRRRRRRSRTFDSSIALPQSAPRTLGGRPRSRTKTPAPKDPARTRRRSAERRRPEADLPNTAPRRVPVRIAWRSLLRRIPALLILAGLIGGVAYASTDAQFFVYQAHVRGAQHMAAEVIYQAAGIHEQNIFWIQPREVAQRIVQLDGIKAVRVQCSLPAKVLIEVEEREPMVMWRARAQDQDWWLDEEGVVLPYHGDVGSADTVFVVDSSERSLGVGMTIEPQDIVRSVLQLAAALPEISVFYYDADRGLSFMHSGDDGEWPVYVGSSEDLTHKIEVMRVLTEYLVAQGIRPRYVDVRWADRPVFGKPPGD